MSKVYRLLLPSSPVTMAAFTVPSFFIGASSVIWESSQDNNGSPVCWNNMTFVFQSLPPIMAAWLLDQVSSIGETPNGAIDGYDLTSYGGIVEMVNVSELGSCEPSWCPAYMRIEEEALR